MLKHLSILITGILVCGCSSLPRADFAPDAPSLKVVTFNVNWGGRNADQVVDYLKTSDADLICLQETHRNWEYKLRRGLATQYPHAVFRNTGGAGGIAFMSRHKLQRTRLIRPGPGWYPALATTVQSDIGPVQVVNVHLQPPLTKTGSATLSAYTEGLDVHVEELAHFLRHVDPAAPLIVTGDFNENERQDAVAGMLRSGFNSALWDFDRRSNTWSWPVFPGLTLKNRYDHILYNNQMRCTGAKVDDVDASDHLPVLAVLTRPSGSQIARNSSGTE